MANVDLEKKTDDLFNALKENARSRGLYDVYDNTALEHFTDTLMEGTFRTFMIFFIQLLAPIWVTVATIKTILNKGDKNNPDDPSLLCEGLFDSNTTFTDVSTKLLASAFVFYITMIINKTVIRLGNKPTYKMFVEGKRFKALKRYQWAYLGLFANYHCAMFCLTAGLAIIFKEDSPSGIVLNALAVVFLMGIDNDVLDMDEVRDIDFSDDSSVPFKLGKSLKGLNTTCFFFVRFFFIAGPTFTFICK